MTDIEKGMRFLEIEYSVSTSYKPGLELLEQNDRTEQALIEIQTE